MLQRTRNRPGASRKHRGLVPLLSLIAVLALVLSGCASKGVPEGFEEETVIANAKEVVMLMSARDYAGVADRFSASMKAALPGDALETAVDAMLANLGTFKEYRSVVAGSGDNPTIGKFAVVVIKAAYDNGEVTYTISIDKEGKLTGLYLK